MRPLYVTVEILSTVPVNKRVNRFRSCRLFSLYAECEKARAITGRKNKGRWMQPLAIHWWPPSSGGRGEKLYRRQRRDGVVTLILQLVFPGQRKNITSSIGLIETNKLAYSFSLCARSWETRPWCVPYLCSTVIYTFLITTFDHRPLPPSVPAELSLHSFLYPHTQIRYSHSLPSLWIGSPSHRHIRTRSFGVTPSTVKRFSSDGVPLQLIIIIPLLFYFFFAFSLNYTGLIVVIVVHKRKTIQYKRPSSRSFCTIQSGDNSLLSSATTAT